MPRAKRTIEQRRADEQRREARAREFGFRNRYEMRRALRAGWTPQRVGGPRSKIVAPPEGEPRVKRVTLGLSGVRKLRRESAEWSRVHSRKPTSRYRPGMTDVEVRRYHAAYVDDATRANKIENELFSLRDYLVDQMGYYTDEEFDDRYGITLTRQMVAQYESPELSARLRGETI